MLCNREQPGFDDVRTMLNMATDGFHSGEQRARIDLMIKQYRMARKRRLLRLALRLWRRTEARQRAEKLEKEPERVH